MGIPVVIILLLVIACNKESVGYSSSTGKGGSVTRFTIAGKYLYAASNSILYTYDLANPANPELVNTNGFNFQTETIYPYGKFLFLGTTTGLFIYSIDTPSSPRLIGQASHARSCDPVVVNDTIAYVSLKGSGRCGPAVSGLYIHDIKDIEHPILKNTIALPDPFGLGLQDSILYVCCGNSGLKVFNVKSPYLPNLITTKMDGHFLDVIPYNENLICAVEDGIILYNISDPANPVFNKKIGN